MCGIFGTTEFKTYKKLAKQNLERGSFAFSQVLFENKTNFLIEKEELNELQPTPRTLEKEDLYKGCKYILGHTQAPTSAARKWEWDTAHPFVWGEWMVAHNGVLTNYKQLNEKYTPWNENLVDSSVIPCMLHQHQQDSGEEYDELTTVSKVLSRLEGTAGLWIVNTYTNNKYLYRQGSTVYADKETSTFSSVKFRGDVELLEENTIFLITTEGITSVGSVGGKSPFFIF